MQRDMSKTIQCGDEVIDRVTNFMGIVVAIARCVSTAKPVSVQSREMVNGRPIPPVSFDASTLTIINKGKVKPTVADPFDSPWEVEHVGKLIETCRGVLQDIRTNAEGEISTVRIWDMQQALIGMQELVKEDAVMGNDPSDLVGALKDGEARLQAKREWYKEVALRGALTCGFRRSTWTALAYIHGGPVAGDMVRYAEPSPALVGILDNVYVAAHGPGNKGDTPDQHKAVLNDWAASSELRDAMKAHDITDIIVELGAPGNSCLVRLHREDHLTSLVVNPIVAAYSEPPAAASES